MKNKYKTRKHKQTNQIQTNKHNKHNTQAKQHWKTKQTRKTKQSKKANQTLMMKTRGGASIMNSLEHFAFHEEKSMATPFSKVTAPMNTLFSNKSLFNKTNPNIFRAHFNYGTPYQVELLAKMQVPIPNSKVQNEPHLFIPNMYRYLFLIIELAPFSRLLWLASFNNRSKEHSYQSYLPPMISTPGGVRNYRLQAYKFPKETPPYVTLDSPLSGRADELKKFFAYIKENTKFVGPQPVFIRNYKVKYDPGNALFAFISPTAKKDKLATRINR